MTAMIRNLGKMSNVGLLKPLSSYSKMICDKLRNDDMLKRARIHPFNVLLALKTYEQGHGDKGKLTWPVDQSIVSALNDAFYLSFKVCIYSIYSSICLSVCLSIYLSVYLSVYLSFYLSIYISFNISSFQ